MDAAISHGHLNLGKLYGIARLNPKLKHAILNPTSNRDRGMRLLENGYGKFTFCSKKLRMAGHNSSFDQFI